MPGFATVLCSRYTSTAQMKPSYFGKPVNPLAPTIGCEEVAEDQRRQGPLSSCAFSGLCCIAVGTAPLTSLIRSCNPFPVPRFRKTCGIGSVYIWVASKWEGRLMDSALCLITYKARLVDGDNRRTPN